MGFVLDRSLSSAKLYTPLDGSSMAYVSLHLSRPLHTVGAQCLMNKGRKGDSSMELNTGYPTTVWFCFPKFTLKEGMLTLNHEQIDIKTKLSGLNTHREIIHLEQEAPKNA